MILRNPLPLPDRGHRTYGLPSEATRSVILKVLRNTGGFREQFTFCSGPTKQTLLWDGFTVLNLLDKSKLGNVTGNAISVPVKDPLAAADEAVKILSESGYVASVHPIEAVDLPPNRLVVVDSNAFEGWVLVFRRHVFKMPKIERRKSYEMQ